MKVRVTKKLAEGPIEIPIHTEFIKLQDFLKFANAIESGGMAKTFIQEATCWSTAKCAPCAAKSCIPATR